VQVRVLVVEDHVALASPIGESPRDAGFAVDVVYHGAAAPDSTTSTGYDAVLLDRDLRQVHGDLVCRALVRDGSPSRILMLTAAAGRRGSGGRAGSERTTSARGCITQLAPEQAESGRRINSKDGGFAGGSRG
jgi:CheY-like chemotaxis protein